MPSHIYVAEDDPDVRMSICEILREEGYDVREFVNGQETLNALQAGDRPCVVLMDLLMPEMSGNEFLTALRNDPALSPIPVVMITGARTDVQDIEVLRKPFELTDLIATVARHCGHASKLEDPSNAGRGRSTPSHPQS
jgi:CheY-like chemotaxis protein